MTRRLRNFSLLTLMVLTLGSADAVAKDEPTLAEIEAAAAPYCLDGEVVHRVVLRSAESGLYQVDLCQAGEPVGGRRYRAKLFDETWKFEQEDNWLACVFSDPVLQVRLMVPVDLALAVQIVGAVMSKLGPGEEVSRVKSLEEVGENGEPHDAEPIPDTYSVTTRYLENPGGRLFNFHATADSLKILSVRQWSY